MARVQVTRPARVVDQTAVKYWGKGVKRSGPIGADSRVEFFECFGITPDNQMHLEAILQRPFPLTVGPMVVSPAAEAHLTRAHSASELLSEYN
jgi:hypothetical protein